MITLQAAIRALEEIRMAEGTSVEATRVEQMEASKNLAIFHLI